jgi:hypothetical protein
MKSTKMEKWLCFYFCCLYEDRSEDRADSFVRCGLGVVLRNVALTKISVLDDFIVQMFQSGDGRTGRWILWDLGKWVPNYLVSTYEGKEFQHRVASGRDKSQTIKLTCYITLLFTTYTCGLTVTPFAYLTYMVALLWRHINSKNIQ